MIDSIAILKLSLPENLIEHFNINKVEDLTSRLDIYFEEMNVPRNELTHG